MEGGLTLVLDVGKTNAKMSLWNRAGDCVARRARANVPQACAADAGDPQRVSVRVDARAVVEQRAQSGLGHDPAQSVRVGVFRRGDGKLAQRRMEIGDQPKG